MSAAGYETGDAVVCRGVDAERDCRGAGAVGEPGGAVVPTGGRDIAGAGGALISHHEILTREEEAELFARLRAGDEAARNELIERNQRLVVSVAKRHMNRMDLEDLMQIGTLGLIRAISKFEPERGLK